MGAGALRLCYRTLFSPKKLFLGVFFLLLFAGLGSRIERKANILIRHDPKTGEKKFASFHDLRRTFGLLWAGRLPNPQHLQELMRHSSIQVTQTFYIGHQTMQTADAMWATFDWQYVSTESGNQITANLASNR